MIEKIIINEEDMTALKQSCFLNENFFDDFFFGMRFLSRVIGIMLGWNIQYEEKLDMLAVIIATLNESGEGEQKYAWKEVFRFYVDRKKNTYIPGYRIEENKYESKVYIRTDNIFIKKEFNDCAFNKRYEIESMICTNVDLTMFSHRGCQAAFPMMGFRMPFMRKAFCGDSIDEIRKFFDPYYITENGSIWEIYNFVAFLDFLNVKEPKKNESENQKKLDELSNLKELGVDTFKNSPLFTHYHDRNKMAVIERLPDDSGCVLRTFCIFGRERDEEEFVIVEVLRFYIFKDSYIYAKRNNVGEWVEADMSTILRTDLLYNLMVFEEDILKDTVLSYTYDLWNDLEPNHKAIAIVSLITNAVFEQLYKVGYKNLVKYLFSIESDASMPINDLEYMCGITDPTKHELYAKFGLNKFQFDSIFKKIKRKGNPGLKKSYFAFPSRILRLIVKGVKYEERKRGDYWGRNNFVEYSSISNMDNATFLKLLSLAEYLQEYNEEKGINDHMTCIDILTTNYGLKSVLNMRERLMQMDSPELRLYRDYLCMVEKLEMYDKYKYTYKDVEELKKWHDEAVELYNQVKEVKNREKFLQRVDTWKQWEYEDKKYAVIAPNAPEEISDEGTNLHHCVGSYIDRVTQGRTNIMFIRKKSNPSKSFFTAEVSNKGEIIQIHGFSNKELSEEPNLIYFIKDWVKERKLNGNYVL